MKTEKAMEEARRTNEEKRAVEDLEAAIRQDAERAQAKRTEYITALRTFLSENSKFQVCPCAFIVLVLGERIAEALSLL